MRHLHQYARSIARIGLATAGAAVVQITQNLEGLLDDRMRLFAFDVDHEADATGFMFKPGIVKALLGRQTIGSSGQIFHFVCFMPPRLHGCRWSNFRASAIKFD